MLHGSCTTLDESLQRTTARHGGWLNLPIGALTHETQTDVRRTPQLKLIAQRKAMERDRTLSQTSLLSLYSRERVAGVTLRLHRCCVRVSSSRSRIPFIAQSRRRVGTSNYRSGLYVHCVISPFSRSLTSMLWPLVIAQALSNSLISPNCASCLNRNLDAFPTSE